MKASILSSVILLTTLAAAPAFGQAQRSLDGCMREASKSVAKYQAAKVKGLAKCFERISKDQIKDNRPDFTKVAKACSAQLRKFVNTQRPGNTLLAKTTARIDKRCQPARNPHTTDQVLSLNPVGVPQGIQAKNMENFCISFGGTGVINSVSDWTECQLNAAECGALQQVATEFPRALEWMDALRPALVDLGPKFLDGVVALDDIHERLDSDFNGEIDLNCGPGVTDCGNGVVDAGEQCDGADLNGETCLSLGFANGGNLTCLGNCAFNLNSCFSGTFPKTGQTLCYATTTGNPPTLCDGTGQDGEYQIGPEFSYTDNGDGTVTDNNTGLMWEKKSQDGSMHNWQISLSWHDSFDIHINRMNNTCDGFEGNPALLTPCNSDADCIGIGNGLCGHAGHRDWRVPNRHELHSIINVGTGFPAVHPAFDNNCVLGCNVLDCSCTVDNAYWSSTTYATAGGGQAWVVVFAHGRSDSQGKNLVRQVRAVRGPS